MRAFLGVDIGGTNVKAAIVLEDGSAPASASSVWSGGAPGEAVETSRRLLLELRNSCASPPDACGVGCAGLVNSEAGVVHTSPNLPSWCDVPLARAMRDALGLRVLLDNDANAAAYAELKLGAARDAENAVVLTLGTGVGAGIVVDGRIYRGGHGFAGEVGHTIVDGGGASDPCGRGALEERVNAASIVRRAVELAASASPAPRWAAFGGLTARDVGRAAAEGDAVALKAVRAAGRELAAGLVNLVAVLDPEIIVIGGGVAAAGAPLFDSAREHLAALAASCHYGVPPVVPAELGERAGVIGAALLARDRSTA